MLTNMAKMWVSIFTLFVVLGVLIIGGDWFEQQFGTWPTVAVFVAFFLVLITLSTVFRRRG